MKQTKSIKILYDGDCPICQRKVHFLQRRDRRKRLRFINIRIKEFNSYELGAPINLLEQKIHAILPNGTVIHSMEVIRVAYREIGLGWLIAPTDWPLLKPLFDALYEKLAKQRQTISRAFRPKK